MPKPGPLAGVRVLDLSALGPGPFASMMLADFGAEVLSLRRPGRSDFDPAEGMARGKDLVGLDLARPGAVDLVKRLARTSDVLLESFRPGVMERWGLGPDALAAANPRLIYARLTGWGQDGPYAANAGHDINYLAIAGPLGATGLDQPIAPPALLGDLANGAYPAVTGVVMALFERERIGRGQVIDIAIADSAAFMLTALFGEYAAEQWNGRRGEHVLSGAAPFYGAYRCADGGWFSVGAIEAKFYAAFLDAVGLADVDRSAAAQWDRSRWPALRERVAAAFARRTRDEWTRLFEGAEACGAPILELTELADDEHLAARGAVTRIDGRLSAAPAPRLSGHPDLPAEAAARSPGSRDPAVVLAARGFLAPEIDALVASGAVSPG